MTPERWQQIESLYHAARERGRGVLEGTEADLRAEVEKLLAEDSGGKILDGRAGDLLAQSMTVEVSAGTQLGPYRIDAPIGAGGMGQVFRATDTRLGRSVAIKTSKLQFSERFEREARAISALNHGHICTLYDVGPNYLVMELVEGETLAARLKHGKLTLEEVLRYGGQIASALAAAHARGIIHRDLKPGNVMVTKAGVKLLDFGLAKSAQDAALTATREVMGTPAYMAPEQFEGKEADARTDIYAFGLVLYEMVTGKRAQQGEMPPLDQLTANFAQVVERCLQSDPEERWQNAQDLKIALQWSAQATPMQQTPTRGPLLPWLIGAAGVIVALVFGLLYLRRHPEPERSLRLGVPLPEGSQSFGFHAISPDGQWLAFVATTADNSAQLFVRRLDDTTVRALAPAYLQGAPFWSPDSRWIAFFDGTHLAKIQPQGGTPEEICVSRGYAQGTWGSEGEILFWEGSLYGLGIHQVRATGGEAKPLLVPDSTRQEAGFFSPQFLPDGRHFLVFTQSPRREKRGIYIGSLGSKETKLLLNADENALFAGSSTGNGHLLSMRGSTLVAQPFDAQRMALQGEPVPVAQGIAAMQLAGNTPAVFSASNNGVLAYRQGSNGIVGELVWRDRQGRRVGVVGEPGTYITPALSPDQTRLAVVRVDQQNWEHDIWLFDLKAGTSSRFTFDAQNVINPIWSPDGAKITFSSTQNGPYDIFQKPSNGAGRVESVLESAIDKYIVDWSSDGHVILYNTPQKIWAWPLGGKPSEIASPGAEIRMSPNGRWIAYQSPESGRREIYVQSYPPSGGKWQVSKLGGLFPVWRRDGKELFYMEGNRLMAVDVQPDGQIFSSGTPHPLFNVPASVNGGIIYQATADGQRFLVVTPLDKPPPPITVAVNWEAGLKK